MVPDQKVRTWGQTPCYMGSDRGWQYTPLGYTRIGSSTVNTGYHQENHIPVTSEILYRVLKPALRIQ